MAPTKTKPPKTRKEPEAVVTDMLVGFVIDRSSSMTHLSEATVGGFNQFLAEQKALADGNLFLSLLLFDDNFDVRYVAEPVGRVPEMTLGRGPNGYWTRGSTALYDATATMIEGVDAWLARHEDFGGRVLIGVLTDGEENMSRRTTLHRLNELIGERTARGWQFAFLGSGGTAWLEGQKSFAPSIGVVNTVQTPATAKGTVGAYGSLSTMTANTRSTGQRMTTQDAYDTVTATDAQSAADALGGD